MLAGKIPSNEMPIHLKKVKGKKGTNTGQFNIDLFFWKYKYKEWVDKAKNIEECNKKLYSMFDDQCSPRMKTQVKGSSRFKIIKAEHDDIKLLGIILEIMFGVQQHLQNTWDMVKSDKCIYNLWQRSHATNSDYIKNFD